LEKDYRDKCKAGELNLQKAIETLRSEMTQNEAENKQIAFEEREVIRKTIHAQAERIETKQAEMTSNFQE
jgi:hypothetical protein